jgi:hypothetical protein
MAKIIKLHSAHDNRGSLTVIERVLPFEIKRIFYVYNIKATRGGHRHKLNHMALVALGGTIEVEVNNPSGKKVYVLNSPDECLHLDPEDWHQFSAENTNAVLMAICSHEYDPNDYITENYK